VTLNPEPEEPAMSTALFDRPPPTRRLRRWWWAVAAVVAVLLAVPAVALVLTRSGSHQAAAPPQPSTVQTTAPQVPSPSANPSANPSSAPALPAFNFLPLWPFDSVAQAVAWQEEARPGGHQPWHVNADETALVFTNTYLQFDTVNRVLGTTVKGDEAWVSVGWRLPNGADTEAAVLHLARIGAGDYRPWEVVGTRDTTLTLTTPAYGARITSPVTVGGRITGVDESLRIQVRGNDRDGLLGETAGIPAGGENRPWSATVSFRASAGTVRTLVVSTAAHAGTGIGRFAIIGAVVG